ncbi:DNA mismatch repair protein MutS [Listeria floridensis FSL S10-1187]|uniref:DNA mismatch repair protein MutS n=1 Tax=Listeria floridensis FSL S10-1187 TaxID=1265817 RepID=A0ABP3B001_9LIST|nr:DNA mismatch repair protein MutS [Listeria floridensis FSL S10-1187]
MFFDDALKASQILEITLTGREGGGTEKIPMCGVPYHSASGYIDTLIEKGYKVAICEQVEDPKTTKGMVKREVVQLISPGTVMDEKGLKEKENNYIAAFYVYEDKEFGFAYSDLSTGELKSTVLELGEDRLVNELSTLASKEVVARPDDAGFISDTAREQLGLLVSIHDSAEPTKESDALIDRSMALSEKKAVMLLLHYLTETQKRDLGHLQKAIHYETTHFMKMDYYSKRNLELSESIRGKGRSGTLLWLLDQTKTAMGGRLLKQWIDRPLIERETITARQADVEELMKHFFERVELAENLKNVYDLERLSGRVAYGNVNARDLVQLRNSLFQIPKIKATLGSLQSAQNLNQLASLLDPCEDLADLLEQAIIDSPPLSIREGGIIKDGYNEQLDQYRDASRNGKTWIAELEQKERQITGIKSLKVGFNRVFGYYIEVTRANTHLLEEGRYERKQTLTNAERYITPELKEKERLILDAEEKSVELEYQLFTEVREAVKHYIERLQKLAKSISEIDCLQSFAEVSERNHFVRPTLSEDGTLQITEGRHPVVERVMGAQSYVANDCTMSDDREILLITGPNMSGKSTYMRQIALTAICAQVGCFVPAKEAILPIFDRVFTRIGAADDLIAGQSTFMVEMLEARNAIVHATKNSLILFDEIGRGTATYDGMALAQAIIEYIHENVQAKTLFSTHYHELTVLEEELPHLKNIHVSAVEENGKVVFLHKIKDGPADKSYGIHVAELARLPKSLIERAAEILQTLEEGEKNLLNEAQINKPSERQMVRESSEPTYQVEKLVADEEVQLPLFEIEEKPKAEKEKPNRIEAEIKMLNLMQMTPLDAMNKLFELQSKLK